MNQPGLQRLDCATLDRYFSDLVAFAVDADHFPLKIYVSKFESSNLSPAESSTQTKSENHGVPRACGALVLHAGVKQRGDLVT
jgi:hypothetical protein